MLGGLLLAVPYAFLFVTFSQSDFLSQFRPEMTAMELISVLGSLIWIGLAIYLIAEIGSLAITRLLLASGGTTVGEALKFALILVLISIAANIIIALGISCRQLLAETIFPDNAVVSLIIGLTMLALSLYLNSGRFAAAIPAIAAKEIRNPLRALQGELGRDRCERLASCFVRDPHDVSTCAHARISCPHNRPYPCRITNSCRRSASVDPGRFCGSGNHGHQPRN